MPYLSRDVVSSDTDDDTPLLVPLKYVPTADRERLERSLSSTTLYFGDCSRCSKRTALNQLSFKTRFSHLVRGYIRNQNENVPQDVTSLCMRYIGGPRMLNVSNLMTLDEYGYGCCGHATFCGKLFAKRRGVHPFIWLLSLFRLILFFCAKDIAALVIVSCYECNSAISIGNLTVSTWLCIAAIVNIFFSAIWIFTIRLRYNTLLESLLDWKFLLFELLKMIWIVIGFTLWGHMETGYARTSMVLSWCILEIVWGLVPCCWNIFMRYCFWMPGPDSG